MARRITRAEWNAKQHHGYTHVYADGTLAILTMGLGGGTTLEPVELEPLPPSPPPRHARQRRG